MSLKYFVISLCISSIGTVVSGSDHQFGADGIPYLAREVQEEKGLVVVIEGIEVRPVEENSMAWLFTAKIVTSVYPQQLPQYLQPFIQPQAEIRIAVLRETSSRPDFPRAKCIAILYPELSEPMSKKYGVYSDRGVHTFLTINGRFGIVDATDGARVDAFRAYLSSTTKERINWSRTHFESQDMFLQRSAILETTIQSGYGEGVIALCRDALKSDRVSPTNKDVVVSALQYSKSDAALAPLKELALDVNSSLLLRTSALRAMKSVSGGNGELTIFKNRSDSTWLSEKSKEILTQSEGNKDIDSPGLTISAEQVIIQMKSSSFLERRQAIEAAGSKTYSRQIGDALLSLCTDPKERLTVQELAVERFGAFNNRSAAEHLAEIAKNSSLRTELRRSAIMALRRIDAGISEKMLKELADALGDIDLKNLSNGLLNR